MKGIVTSRSIPGTLQSPSPKANRVAVAPFAKNEALFAIFDKIVSVIKETWPKKTPQHVHHCTGVSERAVQFWLARETGLSLENVIALLRTEAGYGILDAIMGDSQVEWWITTKNAHELRITRRQIAEAQRRLDAIKAGQRQIDLFEQ